MMKVVLFVISLTVAVSQGNVVPRSVSIPTRELAPRYTAAEWLQELANQKYSPEVVPNFKAGTVRQIEGAGSIRGDAPMPTIIGGADAVIGQFPWQVSMTVDDSWFCGGSVISDTWVLTAAHCARTARSFVLVFGTLTPDGDENTVIQVATTYIIHENYQPARLSNDIAVIKLDSSLIMSDKIGPIRLPSKSQVEDTFAGEVAIISGWGLTSDSATVISDTLKYVDLEVITNAECSETFNGVLSSQLCTSGGDGKSICSGDSGGPLVLEEIDGLFTEIGVVSYGSSAGCELGYPQGFTRVTSYLGWIETNTGIIIRD